MKRLAYTVLILFFAVTTVAIVRHFWQEISRERMLGFYSKNLRRGESREAVEEYLNAQGTQFQKRDLAKNVVLNFDGRHLPSGPSDPPLWIIQAPPADIIKIGEEWGGLVCANSNVTIVIEFVPQHGGAFNQIDREGLPSDTLNQISLSREPGACM